MAETVLPIMSSDRLGELLRLVKAADTVELKLSVPDGDQRSAVQALGIDPLDAQIRQVVFFDTPDLALDKAGVVIRARRVQRRPGDAVVKLRPVDPDRLPPSLRRSPDFGVEVDAMPGGSFVASATMKAPADNAHVKDVLAGQRPIRKLFTKQQRDLFAAFGPDGIELDELRPLGPIPIMKLKFASPEIGRRMVAELWFYPDGNRILELSTKCLPAEALNVAAESRAFLGERGIDLGGVQLTKTRTALAYFAQQLTGAGATPSRRPRRPARAAPARQR
ncbi:adenylate cyclase [Jiangella ureilytica]|uniref:Adenylate cyclase n=1 Tax=Jiangella ureilytica TaxID=2530374 RepID=A0A4R4RUA2_9ACTN|nr:adenylate cyclase [Jiangella ureilytica]TDC52899.1 adenylate cyclase [Jiangella ureilytica]